MVYARLVITSRTRQRISEAYARVGVDQVNTYEVGGPFPAFATLLRLPLGRLERGFTEDFELFVPTRPLELREVSGGMAQRRFSYRRGTVAFTAPGVNWSIEWDGVIEGLSLIILPQVMESAARELFDEDPQNLSWRTVLSDNAPAIAYLGLDVVSQASLGYAAGDRHFEQIVKALFSMVIRRYASTPERDTAAVGITSRTVLAAVRFVDRNLASSLTVQSIADAAGASPPQLNRKFRAELGMSIWAYVQDRRLRKASHILSSGQSDLNDVGHHVGFATQPNFERAFSAKFGMSPRKYRELKSAEGCL